MNPLVSVIIPAYNAESFIVETLDSVVAQTYRPIEIIVVDDGSIDRTAEEVDGFIRSNSLSGFDDPASETNKTDQISEISNPSITYLYQLNSGPSAARNAGIKAAKGEYIAFLDADDLWPSEKIERQVAVMAQHPEICLIFGDMVNFGLEERELLSHFRKNGLNAQFFGNSSIVTDAFRKIYHNNFIPTPTVLVRREVLERTGGFDEEIPFSEDYLLWLRCARLGVISYQDEVMMLRRKHANNLTRDTAMNVFIRPKVLERIEKEHGEYLRALGLDLRQRYGEIFFQIGYFRLYQQLEYRVASDFIRSFRYRPNLKAAIYAAITAAGMGRWAVALKKLLRQDA